MITMSTRPLRILVVDDDPAMVGAITALVGTEGHQVITAYDGLTAVKRFREENPDLVLLDLAMPGPDGFNVAGQMRAVGPAPILIVSGESGEAAKVRALGLGADDYLTKPFGKAELLARISAVMRRVDRSTGPGTSGGGPLTAGGLVLEPGRHEARVGETALALTPTEFRLLEALVRAGGDIVPHLQLARAGWPAETDPDLLWLKPHLARLRSKVIGGWRPPGRGGARRGLSDRRRGRPDRALSSIGSRGRKADRGGEGAGSAGRSDGDGDRAAGRIVRGVGTGHAASARIPATDRVEVEERLAGRRQATAAGSAGDRSIAPVADRGRPADLGIGGMDHRGHLSGGCGRAGADLGSGDRAARG